MSHQNNYFDCEPFVDAKEATPKHCPCCKFYGLDDKRPMSELKAIFDNQEVSPPASAKQLPKAKVTAETKKQSISSPMDDEHEQRGMTKPNQTKVAEKMDNKQYFDHSSGPSDCEASDTEMQCTPEHMDDDTSGCLSGAPKSKKHIKDLKAVFEKLMHK